MKGVESGAWVAPTEGQQFPATLSLQPESQQGLSRLSLSSSLLMLQEWPLPHCCSSLSSKLLCTSFPCVPWRCEGHSPSQPSLPPQAQDPSTGCSWMASSCGSAPAAVGTLPHWRRGPELKPSLLPPENLGPGIWSLPGIIPGHVAVLHLHSSHSAKQSLEGLPGMETGLWLCWERWTVRSD